MKEVEEWVDKFTKLFMYKYDIGSAFRDYVRLARVYHNAIPLKEIDELRARYEDVLPEMSALYQEQFEITVKGINQDGCYDFYGTVYEMIVSRSKASGMGQFFTPMSAAKAMAIVTVGDNPKKEPVSVLEPACGSGRTLLALHDHMQINNWYTGDDFDSVCVDMCANNMMFHGMMGVVRHAHSLTREVFAAYVINPHIHEIGVPHILEVHPKNVDYWYNLWELRFRPKPDAPVEVAPNVEKVSPQILKSVPPPSKGTQLTIW